MTKAKAQTAAAATGRTSKTAKAGPAPVGTGPAPGVTAEQGIPAAGRIGKNNVTSRPVTPGNSGTQPSAPAPEARGGRKRVTARPRNTVEEGDERDLGPMIRVQATAVGFVDNARRREGDVFDVHEAEFSDRWMVRVHDETPERITGPKAALTKIHDEKLVAKFGTGATVEGDPLGSKS